MTLAPGSTLGPYRIVSPLGAGGMGEVYRAADPRLGREVAIKVLPPEVAGDAMRLERFTREARAAAALNHPNILAVYDVAVEGDVHYLVSELLEGQTLAERLHGAAGALAARKAVDLGQQIAQGLAAAHAQGIVHRDLKPANVFVTADGRAKILDFGLAKQTAALATGMTTITGMPPDTDPGQVLGTVGYMAPEQVRGQVVDARADLFAFGAVLYEMLAGRRAFVGETAADTISAVLGKDPPDLSTDHVIPPALERIVARCLEKDPAARFQSAADLAFALRSLTSESAASGAGVVAASPTRAQRSWREWALGAAALVGVTLAAVSWTRQRSAPAAAPPGAVVAQFTVDLVRASAAGIQRVALAPDGASILAYINERLWVYSLADGSVSPLSDTATRAAAGWSPDGSAVVTLAASARQLRVIRLQDRSVTTLAETEALAFPVTIAWSRADEVVVGDGAGRLLVLDARLPGASPRMLRTAGGPRRHVAGFLSNDREFLSVNDAGPSESVGLFRSSTDGHSDLRIDTAPWDSAVVIDDTTLLARRATSIYEVRLNATADAVVGEPHLLVSNSAPGLLSWSVSTNGVLALGEQVPLQFHWYSRSGDRVPLASAGPWGSFDMTPDGRRIVTPRQRDGGSAQQSLWMLDGLRGIEDRLTFSDARDSDPSVSSDGQSVAFVSGGALFATTRAFIVREGQPARMVFEDGAGVALDDWTSDGQWFVYHHRNTLPEARRGLLAVRVDGATPSRVVARCEGVADSGRVSSDGKWLAYSCNETGRHEVYVQPFLEDGPRLRVSVDGGMQPTWKADGTELYYLDPRGTMMAVGVRTSGGLDVARPSRLFDVAVAPNAQSDQYRVTADGQRFLVLQPAEGESERLRVIINWPERFRAQRSGSP